MFNVGSLKFKVGIAEVRIRFTSSINWHNKRSVEFAIVGEEITLPTEKEEYDEVEDEEEEEYEDQ